MRLSLLRAPKAPDGHADMGRHSMRWAILPHSGPLSAECVRAAYGFNSPLQLYRLAGGADSDQEDDDDDNNNNNNNLEKPIDDEVTAYSSSSLLRSIRLRGDKSLILDCIKRGEDDEDVSREGSSTRREGRSVIIRIYEAMGGKSQGSIQTTLPVHKITQCNLLEDDGAECETYMETSSSVRKERALNCEIQLRAFEVVTFRLHLRDDPEIKFLKREEPQWLDVVFNKRKKNHGQE